MDFPGRVACTVFLPGCHLRCPFCHNAALVDPNQFGDEGLDWDLESLRTFLKKRARVLGGVVISGGEPLLHPDLPALMNLITEWNLPVKLDTAGLLPDRLARLMESHPPDYVAVDLKTIPERYDELGWAGRGDRSAANLLKKTIDLLNQGGIDYEVRTTVVPGLVDRSVLESLSPLASMAPRWYWQPYHGGRTLHPDWSNLNGLDEKRLQSWAETISCSIPILVR